MQKDIKAIVIFVNSIVPPTVDLCFAFWYFTVKKYERMIKSWKERYLLLNLTGLAGG